MAASCRIRLLGGFEVEVDGHPLPSRAWKLRDSADLVKVLALEPSYQLRAYEAAQRLWPDLSPEDAAKRLGKAVKGVRKTLGDPRAVTDEGQRLRLWPHGQLWVDVHTFMAMAKHARNDEQRAAALALNRGQLLPDDCDCRWTAVLRTRVELVTLDLRRDPSSLERPWIDLREPRRPSIPEPGRSSESIAYPGGAILGRLPD